jgi:hypothetical protein
VGHEGAGRSAGVGVGEIGPGDQRLRMVGARYPRAVGQRGSVLVAGSFGITRLPRPEHTTDTEDVRSELPAGQVRDQVPPVNREAAWIGGKRKAALIGDIALVDGGSRSVQAATVRSSCSAPTALARQAGPDCVNCASEQPGYVCSSRSPAAPGSTLATLGGDQRHAELWHQALVSGRHPGHRLFPPAAASRRPRRPTSAGLRVYMPLPA